MPKLIGSSTRVVDHEGLTIDELAGNVASKEDTLSVARVVVTTPTAEPWLTLDYDEWICVLKGKIEMHYQDENNVSQVMTFVQGQTCFIAKGERFRPVFPEGNTEYIPVCIPAFKPERCLREEEGVTEVSQKLQQLHSDNPSPVTVTTTQESAQVPAQVPAQKLYHMCQKSLWEKALSSKTAYVPPTFEQDGYFTHATAVPGRLLETANHFYTDTNGDWICVELSSDALLEYGISTRFEEAKPVGDADVSDKWGEWACPHIYGGIPAFLDGVVNKVYEMKRDDKGTFLSIEGISA